ncbi:MAG: amidase [Parafilimonas sp.]
MKRRNFIRNSSFASIAISASSFASSHAIIKNEFDTDDLDFSEITIDALQQKMQTGALTAVDITKKYLKRIQSIDKSGVYLNAVIEINPDALNIALAMDKERKQGKVRSALHGIPVLIKDNISTGDKMMTTAGALALIGNVMQEDAFIIQRLREAGAVLLGKTNLSEWANFRSSRSTSGWSSRGGQTKCPYILDRNPSGSSAGSGAATAAGLCVISIGTETDGSIVSPSSVNGLVGIKPTVGLWSRSRIIPISATQDTAGPMARTVKDAAILLGACTGVDADDFITNESNSKSQKDYTAFLNADGLKGMRIGIEKSHLNGHEGIVALYKNSIQTIKNKGAEIIEVDLLKGIHDIKNVGDAEFTVLLYEFKDGVNNYLASANSKMKTLADVIEFNKQNADKAMPYFKQETLIAANEKGDLNSKEYTDALATTLSSRQIIIDMMKQNNLDALCGVTNGLACCIDLVNGDYDTGFSFSTPAAISGFPHITVPMGFVHDLPVGISFFSTAYTEPQLLSIAYAYEQATKFRKSPLFKKDLLM